MKGERAMANRDRGIRLRMAGICAVVALLTLTPTSRAGFIITFSESGGNVIAKGTGTLNLAALTSIGGAGSLSSIDPSHAYVIVGPSALTLAAVYTGFSGPSSF